MSPARDCTFAIVTNVSCTWNCIRQPAGATYVLKADLIPSCAGDEMGRHYELHNVKAECNKKEKLRANSSLDTVVDKATIAKNLN